MDGRDGSTIVRVGRCALIAAATCLLLGASPAPDARIEMIKGTVEIGRGTPPVWRAAHDGDRLAPYETVRTGKNGRAEIHLSTGTVRLYPGSLLRLSTEPGDTKRERLRLEQGSSLFDVLKRSQDETFEVETRDAVLVVKGTRFSVTAAPDHSSMAVFHGLVGVHALSDGVESEVLVRPGFAVVAGAAAPLELMVNDAADPWEAWGQALPAPALKRAMPQPPAKLAVDLARESALLRARPQVAERMERMKTMDPKAMARAKAMRADGTKAGDATPGAASVPVADRAGQPGQMDTEADEAMRYQMSNPDLDDVSDEMMQRMEAQFDAVEAQDGLMEEVQEEYAESAASGGTGSTGLDIDLVDGSAATGPDLVKISGAGIDEQHTGDQLETMISNGTTSFSPALMTLLQNQGMDPLQFATMLEEMLHH